MAASIAVETQPLSLATAVSQFSTSMEEIEKKHLLEENDRVLFKAIRHLCTLLETEGFAGLYQSKDSPEQELLTNTLNTILEQRKISSSAQLALLPEIVTFLQKIKNAEIELGAMESSMLSTEAVLSGTTIEEALDLYIEALQTILTMHYSNTELSHQYQKAYNELENAIRRYTRDGIKAEDISEFETLLHHYIEAHQLVLTSRMDYSAFGMDLDESQKRKTLEYQALCHSVGSSDPKNPTLRIFTDLKDLAEKSENAPFKTSLLHMYGQLHSAFFQPALGNPLEREIDASVAFEFCVFYKEVCWPLHEELTSSPLQTNLSTYEPPKAQGFFGFGASSRTPEEIQKITEEMNKVRSSMESFTKKTKDFKEKPVTAAAVCHELQQLEVTYHQLLVFKEELRTIDTKRSGGVETSKEWILLTEIETEIKPLLDTWKKAPEAIQKEMTVRSIYGSTRRAQGTKFEKLCDHFTQKVMGALPAEGAVPSMSFTH